MFKKTIFSTGGIDELSPAQGQVTSLLQIVSNLESLDIETILCRIIFAEVDYSSSIYIETPKQGYTKLATLLEELGVTYPNLVILLARNAIVHSNDENQTTLTIEGCTVNLVPNLEYSTINHAVQLKSGNGKVLEISKIGTNEYDLRLNFIMLFNNLQQYVVQHSKNAKKDFVDLMKIKPVILSELELLSRSTPDETS